MASFYNSFVFDADTDTISTGRWEDVKIYNTVNVNISGLTGSLTLMALWGIMNTDQTLVELVREELPVELAAGETKIHRLNTKTGWFQLEVVPTGEINAGTKISTLYKTTPSEMIVSDQTYESSNINTIGTTGSLKIQASDANSNKLTTTVDGAVNGLYMHIDSSVNNSTLGVGIENVDSSNGSLYTIVSDVAGVANAATHNGGLFCSLTDVCGYSITSTKTTAFRVQNALKVSLADPSGKMISTENPSNVTFLKFNNDSGTYINASLYSNFSFFLNLPGTVNNRYFVTTPEIQTTETGLLLFVVTNENPVTLWIKVYDMTAAEANGAGELTGTALLSRIKFNIPVSPFNSREINLVNGVRFAHGIHFRLTADNAYNATPIENGKVYITGTYRI